MSAKRSTSRKTSIVQFDIPEKANRVLNVILITMLLLVVRIWHLSVIQYDNRLEESRKPQRKVVVEAAKRATIRDRFNIPLAVNNIQYNAAILYSQFRQIPSVAWAKDETGKRVKKYRRKEYITQLAKLLGEELQLDPSRLEDLIHAKGAFYYHVPFIIKEDLSEREYYRLKMLTKDWQGIQVQRLPKRTYPKGKVAGEIIGYMGAINRQEYEGIIHELKGLEHFIKDYELGESPTMPPGVQNIAQARKRLKELQEKAYKINDYIGKSGIEGRFEEELRGFQGKKSYYSDARGNFLRELPGAKAPLPGQRFLLTISSELQEFAEQLLIQNESVRDAYISCGDMGQQALSDKQPWVKGGAIVAMDPNNGEILAMASFPRIDPNDFIVSGNPEISAKKRSNIVRWFETEDYLGKIWDQKRGYEREIFDEDKQEYGEESVSMGWEEYIKIILPEEHIVLRVLKRIENIKNAVAVQRATAELLSYSGQSDIYWLFSVLYRDEEAHEPHGKKMPLDVRLAIKDNLEWNRKQVSECKSVLDKFFYDVPNDYDKALTIDLCRLVVHEEKLDTNLINEIGNHSLSKHRSMSSAMANVYPLIYDAAKQFFHENDFKNWRANNEKDFLKSKREQEKIALKYPKPYIDYLDQMEAQLFQTFWNKNRWIFLHAFLLGSNSAVIELKPYTDYFSNWHKEIHQGAHLEASWRQSYDTLYEHFNRISVTSAVPYLQSLRTFGDLTNPLYGQYKHLRKVNGLQFEKHLAMAFYPAYGFGYGRSYAFRQATTQGSVFKLVTAYTALTQRYKKLAPHEITKKNLNPLLITDSVENVGKDWIVGYHANGQPIPQMYKGGRLPRSHARKKGKVDLLKALEVSSNPYFSLLAGDVLETHEDLANAAEAFSYGSKTGIDLPAEISGSIPKDLSTNRTGLYALAIGQHSLVVTPLQTSIMLSAIANGGKVLKPKIIHMAVGTQRDGLNKDEPIPALAHFPYQDSLYMVGVDFPIFTSTISQDKRNLVTRCETQVCREVFMPEIVRSLLLDGMKRVSSKLSEPNLNSLSNLYKNHPEAISDFVEVQDTMYAKTSTAEALENLDLDREHGTDMYTHIWFGSIIFEPESNSKTVVINDANGKPELVVVVYLRFGKYGKDAAPIAAQIAKKWRDIKKSECLRKQEYKGH